MNHDYFKAIQARTAFIYWLVCYFFCKRTGGSVARATCHDFGRLPWQTGPAISHSQQRQQPGVPYPDHPQRAYASVEPFRPAPGETLVAAWQRLGALVNATPDVTVTETRADYLRAEATTRWLRFVDDVEWWRDDANDVIHVRSASRLGQRDFGANRQRIEAWRAAFDAGPATQ